MKKIAIIGTAGVPARYGGFETLAHHLVSQLAVQFELSVYCSTKFYARHERSNTWKGARLIYVPLNANGLQSIPYDILSILHALLYADTLLVLGVSGCILLPFIKLFTKKKIVVNIDGLEWRRDKWSWPIKKFLQLSEYLAVHFSDADITDNAAIKRYTAIQYKTLSHLVEYGADHVIKVSPTEADKARYPFLKNKYAFKVCRIEPENNVHMILEAFRQLPSFPLVMVGNWEKSEYGKNLRKVYSHYPHLSLLDPIYDQRGLDLLRSNCALYVHGHSAGGTNPSLVEAMYLALPVAAFAVSYNMATTEDKGAYFSSSEELKNLVERTTSADWKRNAMEMKQVADKRYLWSVIAQKYASLILGFDYQYQKRPVLSSASSFSEKELRKLGLSHLHRQKSFYE